MKARRAEFTPQIVPGVHRLEHAGVNCYLLEGQDGLTLVDTALPATWRYLVQALDHLGRTPADIRAVVLTHAHFDHVGMARRLLDTQLLEPFVDPGDAYIARHPYRYLHERMRLQYPLRFPRALPVLLEMTVAGALAVRGVPSADLHVLRDEGGEGGELAVPGRPRVLATPGHTKGHVALHLPEADAVISGDALVTLDPYPGAVGPRIVAGAATADSRLALGSVEAIGLTGAGTVLPGHGEPWREGAAAAAEAALLAGPS